MASHHSCQCHQHQHQHQHEQQAQHHHHQPTCCCTCPSPQQPQLSPSDPILQAIAAQLLHQQQNHHFSTQYPQQPRHYHQPTTHHHHQQEEKPQSQSQALLYASLLRRITALESSLHQLSSSSSSLKDHAARTIQTHFRAYLVRRSQTLRNLKHLAIIKTTFTSLKSSLSDKPHFNPDILSRKATDLLHKLDFIQGGDPMIRDGKRSMSRELVQFLEYIDAVLYSKARKNVKFVEDARVYKTPQKQFSGEDSGGSSDDQTQVLENLRRKIENIEGFTRVHEEEDEEESQVESEAPSSGASDGDRNPKFLVKKSKGNHRDTSHSQGQNGNSMFCPPLPVQMESMRDDQKKIASVIR